MSLLGLLSDLEYVGADFETAGDPSPPAVKAEHPQAHLLTNCSAHN